MDTNITISNDLRWNWLKNIIQTMFNDNSEIFIEELNNNSKLYKYMCILFEDQKLKQNHLLIEATSIKQPEPTGINGFSTSSKGNKSSLNKKTFKVLNFYLASEVPTVVPNNNSKYLHIFKVKPVPIYIKSTMNVALFSSLFEIFCANKPSLFSLHALVAGLFVPVMQLNPNKKNTTAYLLDKTNNGPITNLKAPTDTSQTDIQCYRRTEMIDCLQQLDLQLQGFINQIHQESYKLHVPKHLEIEDTENAIKMAVSNEGMVFEIEQLIIEWQSVLNKLFNKNDQKKGPLGEIEYWKEKFSSLISLHEQIENPQVRLICKVAKEAECNSYYNFQCTIEILMKQYAESKDNVKFLSTLERHFRTIELATPESGTLSPIIETMHSMMMAIRMVWIISKYYSTEERMGCLLNKIAILIAEKVSDHIDYKTIFLNKPEDAKRKITEGQVCLMKWRTTYIQIQDEINKTETDTQWNFDHQFLFNVTDYMGEKCDELLEIVSILEYYNTLLGSKLRSIMPESVSLDKTLLAVDAIKQQIQSLSINPFEKKVSYTWTQILQNIKLNVAGLDQQVTHLIQNIFDGDLHNVKSTFGLLNFFKGLKSSIKNDVIDIKGILQTRMDTILQQYILEIDRVEELFNKHCSNPPLTKNQPSVAGAMHWGTSLYVGLKQTILKFQDENMLSSPIGKQVKRKYIEVCRILKDYVTSKFYQWIHDIKKITKACFSQPLLAKRIENGEEMYIINFNSDIFVIINETKYIDNLGFEVPGEILKIALQNDLYHYYVSNIKTMLDSFNKELSTIAPAERIVLMKYIIQLKKVFEPGFNELNWYSLGIKDFINKCFAAITEFRNLSRDVQKDANHIHTQIIVRISSAQLIPDYKNLIGPDDMILDLKQVANEIEKHRVEVVDTLVKAYQGVATLLRKIENQIEGSNTGKSDAMSEYYIHWEMRIKNALEKMVLNSLNKLITLLGRNVSENYAVSNTPLFKVSIMLTGNEALSMPPPFEIQSIFQKIQVSIVESCKSFVRWMRGTCIDSTLGELITNISVENSVVFTYFNDLKSSKKILKFQAIINQSIQSHLSALAQYLKTFFKYRHIYLPDKALSVSKDQKNQTHWLNYDYKFQQYKEVIDFFDTELSIVNLGFIQCDSTELFNQLIQHLLEWIRWEGIAANELANERLLKLSQNITIVQTNIRQPCETINDFKAILQLIKDVRNQSLDFEMECREVMFMYGSLKSYQIDVPNDEASMANSQLDRWCALLQEVNVLENNLLPKKIEFSNQTQVEVSKFTVKLKESLGIFLQNGPGKEGIDLNEGIKMKNDWKDLINQDMTTRSKLMQAEILLGLPLTSCSELFTLDEQFKKVEVVYSLYEEWLTYLHKWSNQPWIEIQIQDLQNVTIEKMKICKQMEKVYKEVQPFPAIKAEIFDFFYSLDLLAKLKNPALKIRHWRELMKITGQGFDVNHITLKDMARIKVHKFTSEIESLVQVACKELTVEKEFHSIRDFWLIKEFTLLPYIPRTEVCYHILQGTVDVQETLDDHIMKLQSLLGIRWVEPFINEVRLWEQKLSRMNDTITIWVSTQMKWQYLESIFKGHEDMAQQLVKEIARFNEVDKKWIKIMKETVQNPNIGTACGLENRHADLNFINERLDECQKDLSSYLERKRCIFSRFFFMSDDELLAILASKTPSSVQEHMLKMFDNMALFTFKKSVDNSIDIIEGVKSQELEELQFITAVETKELQVEVWLNKILDESKETLRLLLKAAVYYYPKMNRIEWIKKYHGMLTLCGAKLWWTYQIEDAFDKIAKGNRHALNKVSSKLSQQLLDLICEVDSELTKKERKKINTLIIIDVHSRDIVEHFIRETIINPSDFEWESQIRFYWDSTDDICNIKQCNGCFKYGYEYMGLNGRLVITPLTDRCFMTLTQALTFYFGGAPGGPAGTGKTETVKDLAKTLSIQCVVFNCGEGLDYKAMASIFSGLSQSGSWGCFDEFNRIELPVLSVVSEQIRSIQSALKRQQTSFFFGDKEINLVPSVGIFITMNPGYAGRVELPDNLKALFRPVVMVVPDMELIAENMLFSEGFRTARELAKKMVCLYQIAKGQLSKQHHYDWGLRALKAVLVVAGQLKRESPELSEASVLMRALRDMNAPKYTAEDVPLFKGLLSDLFTGIDVTRLPQEKLSKATVSVLNKRKLKVDLKQIDKVVQLFETMQVRHTSMTVGHSGGGKTVVINTLCAAQGELGIPTKIYPINPKAQSTGALYGVLDPITRNWTDGIFSNIFRNINTIKESDTMDTDLFNKTKKYILFNGDVDAKWVEDLNSIMDDNKLLTLPQGERIRLHASCSILFEVGNLKYASPATISRVGMVYLDPVNLGWEPFTYAWKEQFIREEVNVISDLMNRYNQTLINYILYGIINNTKISPPAKSIPINDLNMVQQLIHILESVLTPVGTITDPQVIESLFIFSCVWSFGAVLVKDEDREAFDLFLKRLVDWNLQDDNDELGVGNGYLPKSGNLFEHYFDIQRSCWLPWKSLMKPFSVTNHYNFNSMIVSTIDTARALWLLENLTCKQRPLMFVGGTGTAKTITVQHFLRNINKRKLKEQEDQVELEVLSLEIIFSNRTTGLDAQKALEDNIEKRTNMLLGPPTKKKLLVFIDDLNMPQVDTYGTQQSIAFLKFLIEYSSWYDRKDLQLKRVCDTYYLAAMAPPGGGRSELDPRFSSMFSVINLPSPSKNSEAKILTDILGHAYRGMSEANINLIKPLTAMTLELFHYVIDSLPATPAKFHYIFNLRDLSRVCEGLCRATPVKFSTPDKLLKLWRNEVTRVFMDRMSDEKDKELIDSKILKLLGDNFKSVSSKMYQEPLLFGDFGDFDPDSDSKRLYLYEEFSNEYDTARNVIYSFLSELNAFTMNLDLIMFDMALVHLFRIIRVLSLPYGHCLLIGVGGSGKQSLSRLAAYICNMSIFEIVITRKYTEDNFKEDLKCLYKMIGVERKKTLFLFQDNHIKSESFLELINNMLASGMVPALFTNDEKEVLYQSVHEELVEEGIVPTKENKWFRFVNICKEHLHIVLAMSPSGDALRTRCRNFPGIINNTVIDWFSKWPTQALRSVAQKHLVVKNLSELYLNEIIDFMVYAHHSANEVSKSFSAQFKRHCYVTPKNFFQFLNNFTLLLHTNEKHIDDLVSKLSMGLQKLATAAVDVQVIREDLTKKEVDLAARFSANETVLVETKKLQAQNEQTSKEAQSTEEELILRSEEIKKDSEEANQILKEAMPVLQKAQEALNQLDPAKISELKAFTNPAAKVVAVVKMVCSLKNISPTWEAGKAMLSQANFLDSVRRFPLDSLTERKMKDVKAIIDNFEGVIDYDSVKTASLAAAELFNWVLSLQKYWEIAKIVAPRKARVAKLEQEKEQMTKRLNQIKTQIEYLETNQKKLNKRLIDGLAEAEKLEAETKLMQKRLNAAERLMNGFESEKTRWLEEKDHLQNLRGRLFGDCLIGAGFTAYVGPFTYSFRNSIIYDMWIPKIKELNIPITEPFNIHKFMTDEVEIANWARDGLPSDELSIQNGILTSFSTASVDLSQSAVRTIRFPLCLDPQEQAIKWIKQKHASNSRFEVCTFHDANFLKKLEHCVQYGYPFLFENVEYIDPVIDPILELKFKEDQGQHVIQLGDKTITMHESFKLYLCTKLSNPQFPAEVFGKTTVINYSVTKEGLESQLLNLVVASERSDLHKLSVELVQTMADNRIKLKQLEDLLIRELSLATGNLLDNDELIHTLENTKSSATDVAQKIKQTTETTATIEVSRCEYQSISKRGAILFFIISQLGCINPMYEYSLSSFLYDVFSMALETSEAAFDISDRLKNIISTLTEHTYNYVCTGMFERHKLMFSFLMTIKILEGENEIQLNELDFLLRGCVIASKQYPSNPCNFLLASQWNDVCYLSEICPVFSSLTEDVTNNLAQWEWWSHLEQLELEEATIPCKYQEKITPFQRLCLFKCFHPEHIYTVTSRFIAECPLMGEKFTIPPILKYHDVFKHSNNTSPIMCIISPGVNPLDEITKLAEKMDMVGNRFYSISLGQGQGSEALKLIEMGAMRGCWILLQNCHLLVQWLHDTEKIIDKIVQNKPHSEFRLWLTTEAILDFPLGILQRSLKVVNEPPNGLKMNLKSIFSKVADEQLTMCAHPQYPVLVYTLAFFHAVIQERRKYGKIGWNVCYDFNETDFMVSMQLMCTYLGKAYASNNNIPWSTLKYLIGEAMYGGRVTDSMDRRIVTTYLDEYFGDFLFDSYTKFLFFSSSKFSYSLPQKNSNNGSKQLTRDEIIAHIDALPMDNAPDVLGLHCNADSNYLRTASDTMLKNLVELMPREQETVQSETTQDNKLTGIIASIFENLPSVYNREEILAKERINAQNKGFEDLQPIQVVLLQEIDWFNSLIAVMHASLISLRKALAGEVGMSAELDDLALSLINGQLPASWRSNTAETRKTLSRWLVDVEKQYSQFNAWIEQGPPVSLWLSGLRVPESYINALIQTTCRKYKWPLDKSAIFIEITSISSPLEVAQEPENGAYIHGLFLEGASWNANLKCLESQKPKELISELPILHIIPMEKSKMRNVGTFRVPTYVTRNRRNAAGVGLVMEVNLTTNRHVSHWILESVAIVLNSDE